MKNQSSNSSTFVELSFHNRNIVNSLASVLQSSTNLVDNIITSKPKKIYVASKHDFGKSILSKLKGQFEESKDYFNEIDGVIIGKRPQGPIETCDGKDYVSHSIVGGQHIIDNLKRQKLRRPNHHKLSNKEAVNRIATNSNTNLKKKGPEKSLSTISFNMSYAKNPRESSNILNTSKNNCNYEFVDIQAINELEIKFKKLATFNRTVEHTQEDKLNESWDGNLCTINSNSGSPSKQRSVEKNSRVRGNTNLTTISSSQANNSIGGEATVIRNLRGVKKEILDSAKAESKTLSQEKFLKQAFVTERENCENTEVLKSIPYEFQRKLLQQEKTINLYHDMQNKGMALEKYLQSRTKKRNKASLLINSGESHLLKTELINIMDAKIPIEEKRGVFNWIVSLRKPKNFKGERSSYINLGSKENPSWQYFKEVYPVNQEKVVKPTVNLNEFSNKLLSPTYKEAGQELMSLEKYIVS